MKKLVEYRVFVDIHGGEHLQTVNQREVCDGSQALIKGWANHLRELRIERGILELGPCEKRIGYQLVPAEEIHTLSVDIISVAEVDGPEERLNAVEKFDAIRREFHERAARHLERDPGGRGSGFLPEGHPMAHDEWRG